MIGPLVTCGGLEVQPGEVETVWRRRHWGERTWMVRVRTRDGVLYQVKPDHLTAAEALALMIRITGSRLHHPAAGKERTVRKPEERWIQS